MAARVSSLQHTRRRCTRSARLSNSGPKEGAAASAAARKDLTLWAGGCIGMGADSASSFSLYTAFRPSCGAGTQTQGRKAATAGTVSQGSSGLPAAQGGTWSQAPCRLQREALGTTGCQAAGCRAVMLCRHSCFGRVLHLSHCCCCCHCCLGVVSLTITICSTWRCRIMLLAGSALGRSAKQQVCPTHSGLARCQENTPATVGPCLTVAWAAGCLCRACASATGHGVLAQPAVVLKLHLLPVVPAVPVLAHLPHGPVTGA